MDLFVRIPLPPDKKGVVKHRFYRLRRIWQPGVIAWRLEYVRTKKGVDVVVAHDVTYEGRKWKCTCESANYGQGPCKHVSVIEDLVSDGLLSCFATVARRLA